MRAKPKCYGKLDVKECGYQKCEHIMPCYDEAFEELKKLNNKKE